jgi:hypothetical protein
MANSMRPATSSVPVSSLDNIRPTPAKAGLASDRFGLSLNATLIQAVLSYYGSVKGAAFSLGEGAQQPKLDPSLMMREFKDGKFTRLELADADAKAAIARALHLAFDESDPKVRVQRLIRAAHRSLEELAEAL